MHIGARAIPVVGVAAIAVVLLLVVRPAVQAAPTVAFMQAEVPEEVGGGSAVMRILDVDRSPDHRRIAFDVPGRSAGSGAVWIARADESLAHRAVACTAPPCLRIADPAFSPDGDLLLVVQTDSGRGASHVLVVDLRTGVRRQVAAGGGGTAVYARPRWTADGHGAVVQRTSTSRAITTSVLEVVSVRTGGSRTITPPSLLAVEPDVRRSDDLIVFTTAGGGLSTVRLDGTGLRRLTHAGATRFLHPGWAPGGSRVAVVLASVRGTNPGTVVPERAATVDYPSGTVSLRR